MPQGMPGNTLLAAMQQIFARRQGQQQQQPSRSPFGTQLMQAMMRLQQRPQQPQQPKPGMMYAGGSPNWLQQNPAIPTYKQPDMMQPGLGGPRASGMVNPQQWGV